MLPSRPSKHYIIPLSNLIWTINIINWSSAPHSNLECLRISTKKAVRTILSKNKREHALPLFKELSILPLDDHIKLRRATYMWKLKNKLLPNSLTSWFRVNESVIANRIHDDTSYLLQQPRLEYTKRSISYTGVKIWNTEIPSALKKSTSSKLFTQKLKTILLT